LKNSFHLSKISHYRKVELKARLSSQLPQLIDILKEILDSSFDQIKSGKGNTELNIFCKETLEVILQIYSLFSIEEVVPNKTLPSLFKIIQSRNQISLIAFDCINELIEHHYFPESEKSILLMIFNHIFSVMGDQINDNTNANTNANEELMQKFTYFTSTFVSQHLPRVEETDSFPLTAFLELIFKFTFVQNSLNSYSACIDNWKNILENIAAKGGKNAAK